MHPLNRRQILQLTFGAAAAGLLSACAAGSTAKPAAAPAPTSPAAAQPTAAAAQPATQAQPTSAAAQAAPAAGGQKVSIEYWQYFFQSKQDLVNTLIEDFQRQNPNIEIVHN